MSVVRIETDRFGRGRVLLDGQDLAVAVHSMSLHAKAGHSPLLQLELLVDVIESSTEATQVEVVMSDATRDALIAIGWTPPAVTR